MTNTTKTATNRRGTAMDGRAIIRDAKRTAKPQPTYNRRDLVNMSLVTGLAVALMYTTLWLVGVMYS